MQPPARSYGSELIVWRLHTQADLSSLAALWRAAPAEHIFQRFEMAAAWARVFAGPGGPYRPRIWYCENPPLILPLAEREEVLRWLGDGLWDYCDPLGDAAAPEWRQAPVAQAPAALHGIRENCGWWTWFQSQPWKLEYFADAPFYRAGALPPEAAVAALDERHPRITERLDHLLRAGVEFAMVTEPLERQRLLAWTLRQKAARMAALGQANVLGGLEAAWLAEMVACHPEFCELWRLGPADRPWAALLTWSQPGLRLGYTLSFDPAVARHSPGVKLLYAVLRRTVAEGRGFDFLTGSQPFKLRFASGAQRLWQCHSPAAAAMLNCNQN